MTEKRQYRKDVFKLTEKRRTYLRNYYKKYRIKKREHMKKKRSEYYIKNREKFLEYNKKYVKKYEEEFKERRRIKYFNNKEEIKKNYKEYYKNNKDKKKKYYEKNRDKILKVGREYYNINKKHMRASFHKLCRAKIKTHISIDKKKERKYNEMEYITIKWIRDKLLKNNNKCYYCKIDLKLSCYEKHDKRQFSVDRKDNDIAHIKSNCIICCIHCNRKKHTISYKRFKHKLVLEELKNTIPKYIGKINPIIRQEKEKENKKENKKRKNKKSKKGK